MLPDVTVLRDNIKNLPPTMDKASGIAAFVSVIASFMNQVQAGGSGSPGIFTFGNAAMVSAMMAMPPVTDDSWKQAFASAWLAGCTAAVISPGTVSNPAWVGSGTKDVNTSPSAAATIATLSAAQATLLSGLSGPTSDAPLPMATAIKNATLQFTFTCIGLAAPPALTPIPMTFSAQ